MSTFRFQQFEIQQSDAVFKVGTDSVLLGAWANVNGDEQVLDVGTGTGLLAMIVAQKNSTAGITAIEIDETATQLAAGNFSASPFAARLSAICQDFTTFEPAITFDHILSNPPYFRNSLKSPSGTKNRTRHQDHLTLQTLFLRAAGMVGPQGKLSVVIPADVFEAEKKAHGFYAWQLSRSCTVRSFANEEPLRVLAEFSLSPAVTVEEDFVIYQERGVYSEAYRALTGDLYKWFPKGS